MRYVLTFAAFALSAVALAAPAGAAPCWENVIEDWSDNSRVDKRYPIHCYRDALKNLPEDMRAYSSAPDDIARAMRAEIARQNREQEASRPESSGDGDGQGAGGSGSSGGTSGKGGTETGEAAGSVPEVPAEQPSQPEVGVINEAVDEIGPNDATSLPLPVIVLAGIAIALLCAGAASLLARRFQAHRLRTSLRPYRR